MRAGPIIGLVLALAVALGAAGTHLIAVLQAAFDGARIVRGAQLASIVDCNVCHTHGRPYAGGPPIDTRFGTVFSSNITADRETGIGGWSEQTAAAIANATASATGRRIRGLPA